MTDIARPPPRPAVRCAAPTWPRSARRSPTPGPARRPRRRSRRRPRPGRPVRRSPLHRVVWARPAPAPPASNVDLDPESVDSTTTPPPSGTECPSAPAARPWRPVRRLHLHPPVTNHPVGPRHFRRPVHRRSRRRHPGRASRAPSPARPTSPARPPRRPRRRQRPRPSLQHPHPPRHPSRPPAILRHPDRRSRSRCDPARPGRARHPALDPPQRSAGMTRYSQVSPLARSSRGYAASWPPRPRRSGRYPAWCAGRPPPPPQGMKTMP